MNSRGYDNSSIQLTIEKINGKNYYEWTQSIQLVIKGKGKLGYLNSKTEEPASSQPNSLQKWKVKNSMVKAWLIHPMQNSIGKTTFFLATAKNFWDATCETYSNVEDFSHIFEITTKLWQLRQENREVIDFHIEMVTL